LQAALFEGDYINIYWLTAGCQIKAGLGSTLSALRNPGLRQSFCAAERRLLGLSFCEDRSAATTMPNENKMSPDVTRELRSLSHDLSNALETIVQATYLLTQAELPGSARRWLEMMDQASQEAVSLNRRLREILRSQN